MKKLFLAAVAATFLILNFACKKDLKTSLMADAIPVAKVIDGHISFTSKASYENYLSAPDRKKIVNSIPGIRGFVSFKERKKNATVSRMIGDCEVPDTLVEDNSAFFDLLDEDGVIQIENTVYRYDYCNDSTWVITADNYTDDTYYYDFMNGIEVTDIVGSFPNYVDVIEAVGAGFYTMPEPEDTVGYGEIFLRIDFLGSVSLEDCNINNDEEYPAGQNVKMDGKMAYDKFGIYFHFYGKEKYKVQCVINWCTTDGGLRDWYVYYWYQCQRKGNPQWLTGDGNVYPPGSGGENKTDKTFYEGSRGLNWGDAVWKVNDMWTNKRSVYRSQGSGWQFIASDNNYDFIYKNNYQFNTGTNQFEIHFPL